MTKILSILLCMEWWLAADCFAGRKIFGLVCDMDKKPLPGATVMVKVNPKLGVAADANGYYEPNFRNTFV